MLEVGAVNYLDSAREQWTAAQLHEQAEQRRESEPSTCSRKVAASRSCCVGHQRGPALHAKKQKKTKKTTE